MSVDDFEVFCVKRRLDYLSGQVEKAWGDEARERSIQARREAAAHRAQAAVHAKGGMSDLHPSAERAHTRAANSFERAAKFYDKGDIENGSKHFFNGIRHSNGAAKLTSSIRSFEKL